MKKLVYLAAFVFSTHSAGAMDTPQTPPRPARTLTCPGAPSKRQVTPDAPMLNTTVLMIINTLIQELEENILNKEKALLLHSFLTPLQQTSEWTEYYATNTQRVNSVFAALFPPVS